MEVKDLVSYLTYDRLSRSFLIGGTAVFFYLFYELCLTNRSMKETNIVENSVDTDYTRYFKSDK